MKLISGSTSANEDIFNEINKLKDRVLSLEVELEGSGWSFHQPISLRLKMVAITPITLRPQINDEHENEMSISDEDNDENIGIYIPIPKSSPNNTDRNILNNTVNVRSTNNM